ncbi:MAG: 3-hydroxyacyl-CoA dehydrogenase [Paracoccaceae bacterium]|jgi:3-hydroxyacyl-CoA dehydrogenase
MTRKVVVLGGGPAGVTLALALMQPGFSTIVVEPDADAADRAAFFLGRLSIGGNLPVVAQDTTSLAQAGIVFATQDAAIPDVPETALLIRLDPVGMQLGNAPIGIHLYAPIQLRRLVEVCASQQTSAKTIKAVCDLMRDIGRVPVLAPATPSIGARLTRCLYDTADHLLLHGAIPHELDEALVDMGCDIGLYEAQDLIGLDAIHADRNRDTAQRDPARPHALIAARMVAEGRLGKKVGVGWYRYPGGGGAVIDPLIEDLIREEARFAGVQPHIFTAAVMQAQLVQALRDESKAMLADATATAADINQVLRYGLGFPDGVVTV